MGYVLLVKKWLENEMRAIEIAIAVVVVSVIVYIVPSDNPKTTQTIEKMRVLVENNTRPLDSDLIDCWDNSIEWVKTDKLIKLKSKGPDGFILTEDDLVVEREIE